jgi:hypothetical protein
MKTGRCFSLAGPKPLARCVGLRSGNGTWFRCLKPFPLPCMNMLPVGNDSKKLITTSSTVTTQRDHTMQHRLSFDSLTRTKTVCPVGIASFSSTVTNMTVVTRRKLTQGPSLEPQGTLQQTHGFLLFWCFCDF